MFSLKSSYLGNSYEYTQYGDSYEYTQYTIFNIRRKIDLNNLKFAALGFFFLGTQERIRNSRGIGVRVIKVLLKVPILRPPFGLPKSGLFSEVVSISNTIS